MKPNLGDVIADKYRLDRVLGEGGMSTVYAAANVLTGKPVAIKWLQPEIVRDEEQSQRLLREAQATSSLDHPNVVNVFDVGRHGGALFLVMELLHGEPLSELLQRGPQDPYEFVKLMMPVLRGVHAAHRGGVVHRDLKPDNIFMCRDPHGDAREPKVLDFGISKLSDELESGAELTREGTVFGTPQYMAPEQMRDARVADARSDVYALGVIFYRAFSNEYPYDADTLTALAIRIVEGNAVPLSEMCPTLDRGLGDLVMRALALDPEQRFASVAAFGQALEAYSDGVLFAPGAVERDSATQLRQSFVPRDPLRDSRTDSSPSMRAIAPPPPPPRTGSIALREPLQSARISVNQLPTTMLDASELIEAEPGEHETRLSIPPPPPPTNTRPSRGLEVVVEERYTTQRVDRWSRKQSWLIGAALFTIGSVAPAGWQLWQKARGANAAAAVAPAMRAPETGKTASVFMPIAPGHKAEEPTPTPAASGAAQAADTQAAVAARSGGAPSDPTRAAATQDPQEPPAQRPATGGSEAAADKAGVRPAADGAPTFKRNEAERRRRASAPPAKPVAAQPESIGAPVVEPLTVERPAAGQTERNPYLRR